MARTREELALIDSLDMGKPIADAVANDLRVAITCVEYFAEAINKVYGEVAPSNLRIVATITREPFGVVGAVIPWNFPLQLTMWKVAPALAVGNSVIVKPAEQSPLSALRLGQLALEAGVPPGVLNVVPGFGPTAGAAIGRHREIDGVAFTGSGEVGASSALLGRLEHEAGLPGARRQEPADRLRRRPGRGHGRGGDLGRDLLQPRRGL